MTHTKDLSGSALREHLFQNALSGIDSVSGSDVKKMRITEIRTPAPESEFITGEWCEDDTADEIKCGISDDETFEVKEIDADGIEGYHEYLLIRDDGYRFFVK